MANLLNFDWWAFDRGDYNIVVGPVVARVGLTRSAHGIDVDGELPSKIGRRRKLQINLGVKYRLRQRFVITRRQSRVGLAMPLPDFVQNRLFGDTMEEGKNTAEH